MATAKKEKPITLVRGTQEESVPFDEAVAFCRENPDAAMTCHHYAIRAMFCVVDGSNGIYTMQAFADQYSSVVNNIGMTHPPGLHYEEDDYTYDGAGMKQAFQQVRAGAHTDDYQDAADDLLESVIYMDAHGRVWRLLYDEDLFWTWDGEWYS